MRAEQAKIALDQKRERGCCEANSLDCNACMHDLTAEEYCKKRPDSQAWFLCPKRKAISISYIEFYILLLRIPVNIHNS